MTVKTIEIRGADAEKTVSKTRVGCRGIVVKGSQILISHEVNTNYYLIPGGGLENGETLEMCCIREVREETGYIVKPVRCFLSINEYYGDRKYVGYYFICEVMGEGEQCLTESERERGLVPEWIDVNRVLEMYSRYNDFTEINEDKRGSYLREYTALREYLAKH